MDIASNSTHSASPVRNYDAEQLLDNGNPLINGIEYLPNGLPKDYNTMSRPGVPDGSDPSNPVRIYADGVFDMFHVGHAKVLEQAKKLYKHVHLIVGVSGDEETVRYKGKIVMNQEERTEIVKHCKWVDEVICPCPWALTVDFLKERNIHYVAHDDLPYVSAGSKDIYYDVKKALMFRATQRTEGISTSDIIMRIIRDYDMYIERNIERGYSREEIGVPRVKYYQVKAKKAIEEGRKKMAQSENFGFMSKVSPAYQMPLLVAAVFLMGFLTATVLVAYGFSNFINTLVFGAITVAVVYCAAALGF